MKSIGTMLVIMGILFLLSDKLPFVGRLPGDIVIQGKHSTIYLPFATGILLSIILSAILRLVR